MADACGCMVKPIQFCQVKKKIFFYLFSCVIVALETFIGSSFTVVHRLSSCGIGSVVVALGLSCLGVCEILVPRSRIKPASTVSEGGFLTIGQPGKS